MSLFNFRGDDMEQLKFDWRMMIARCEDPKRKDFKYYGARGIEVYSKWHGEEGFKRFKAYVSKLENYGRKGYTLDRIDNDGDYEPGNLRWADKQTQNANRRGGEGFDGMGSEKSN